MSFIIIYLIFKLKYKMIFLVIILMQCRFSYKINIFIYKKALLYNPVY